MLISFQFLLLLLFSCWLFAADYEFSTDTFQLGRWSPKTLSYDQGLQKIEALDTWYEGLTPDKKLESAKAYTLQRNRLFLVTQEKRLKSEIEKPVDLTELATDPFQPSWISAGRNVVAQEKRKMHSDFQLLNESALADEDSLSNQLLGSLSDVDKLGLQGVSGLEMAPSFSKSMSKSGGSMQGLSSQRMAPPSTLNISPESMCKPSDSVCLEKARSLIGRFRAMDFLNLDGSLKITKKLGIQKPICKTSEAVGPAPGSPEFVAFQKKQDEFLKQVGSQNWKSSKKENDLSRWFSEPLSQWVNGRSNNRCAGHAISSDIAATVNKGSMLNFAVSPAQTYGQIQVITREELETRKKQGYILHAEEEDLLSFLKEEGVQSIDKKNASFCDSKFYADPQLDDGNGRKTPLGAIYLGNSINHIFAGFQKKPLCGGRVATSKLRKGDLPLFTIDKFASMEFESPSEQGFDFDFFKRLIDTGNPPIVSLDSEALTESGDWQHIKPSKGKTGHILNVVGYGEDIDPITLCKTKYLKIRNSLGQKKIHYKVPADNFISHIIGIYKVTSIQKTN